MPKRLFDMSSTPAPEGEFKGALITSGHSVELFNKFVLDVESLDPNTIYPPESFPTTRHPETRTSLRRYSDSFAHGRLLPAEAVAILMLLNETAALTAAYKSTTYGYEHISKMLGIRDTDFRLDEVIDGFSRFGSTIVMATGVREDVKNDKRIHIATNWYQAEAQDLEKLFEKPLRNDNYLLGPNTAEKVITIIKKKSQKHGARLAERLYLEVLDRSIRVLPFRWTT